MKKAIIIAFLLNILLTSQLLYASVIENSTDSSGNKTTKEKVYSVVFGENSNISSAISLASGFILIFLSGYMSFRNKTKNNKEIEANITSNKIGKIKALLSLNSLGYIFGFLLIVLGVLIPVFDGVVTATI